MIIWEILFLELASVKCRLSNAKLICSLCLLNKLLVILLLDTDKEKKIDTN